ncbi:MAG: Cof-type HAD-IIB family hydrolase [Lachnospiraceae bacterium]|nr:Cof-type HAD-IIB family hydrolase [Lachnospiraceae bacterium]
MKKPCILCFDIDGTLITDSPERYLPDTAKEAIRLARAAGHLTFINTGRVMLNVDTFIRELDFDGYICGCGTYIRYHDTVLLHHRLEKDLCRKIAELCYDCGVFSLFEAHDANGYDGRILARYQDNPDIAGLLAYFRSVGKRFITDVNSPEFHFDKFSAWFRKDCDMERFRSGLHGTFTYIDRGENFCELVPEGYSKATGIQFLMDYFQIPWENTYAFGDSSNDLPMLDFVKHSAVMGAAPDALKAQADYVTGTVEADGLLKAMEHFGLLG